MDEDRLNMAIRKFLKEVGVTSQREIERVVREVGGKGRPLRLGMTLTSPVHRSNTWSRRRSTWDNASPAFRHAKA